MFLVQGLIILALTIIMKLAMPSNIDETDSTIMLNDNKSQSDIEPEHKISYYSLLSDPIIQLL